MFVRLEEEQIEKRTVSLIQIRDRISAHLRNLRAVNSCDSTRIQRIATLKREYDVVQSEIIKLDVEERELAQIRISRKGFE